MNTENIQPLRPIAANGPEKMMQRASNYARSKVDKPLKKALLQAIAAGIFIGLAFVFYLTVTTGNGDLGWGINRLLGGLVFSMGLIMVVVCGGELFTSTVLSAIARANGQTTTRAMLKTWGVVYLGNFIGATLLLVLVSAASLYQLDGGQWGLTALNVAQHKLHHTPLEAFSLGILCNLMVCLAIWMTFSSEDVLTKAALMMLPVAMFVATGFEHCVANMFMVPLGITIAHLAPAEFWQGIGVNAAQYADLTYLNFISANLLPVTLGNIVGGAVLVGLGNRMIHGKPMPQATKQQSSVIPQPVIEPNQSFIQEDLAMLVKDHMQTQPLTLTADTSASVAMSQLIMAKKSGAPVVNEDQQVIGFFSEQDALLSAWIQDFNPKFDKSVGELMTAEVDTVTPDTSIRDLVEYICVDKKALYQVSDSGIATGLSTGSLLQRAKAQKISRHSVFPVVENNQLVGVITSQDVFTALRNQLGFTDNVVYAHFAKQQLAAQG